MWRKPMSKQHSSPQAVVRTSRLFATGLSPEVLFIIMIDTKNNENLIELKLPRHILIPK